MHRRRADRLRDTDPSPRSARPRARRHRDTRTTPGAGGDCTPSRAGLHRGGYR
jgi:hypothetical protein